MREEHYVQYLIIFYKNFLFSLTDNHLSCGWNQIYMAKSEMTERAKVQSMHNGLRSLGLRKHLLNYAKEAAPSF